MKFKNHKGQTNPTHQHFPHFSVELPLPFGKQKRDIKEGENGSLRNAALSAFEEGAPFMGTALAAYKQSH